MVVPNSIKNVIITKGAIEELSEVLNQYKNPLIVTDDLIYAQYREIIESVIKGRHNWLRLPRFNQVISTDPHDGRVIFGTSKESEINVNQFKDADIIIGFGGGRSIDAAKLLARESGLDWISIPTAASHDGIASDVASVTQDGYRYSEKCKKPIAVLADLSIMNKAPLKLEMSGLGDIICKASSLAEWRLAHEQNDEQFDEKIYSQLNDTLNDILTNYSLEKLVKAEIEAGEAMCQFGSSRPCSGTEHAISHAMDRRAENLHGIQVAFATPICVKYLEEVGYSNYKAVDIQNFMKNRGLPTTLAEMDTNVDAFIDDVHHALEIMERRNRYSVIKHLKLNDKEIVQGLQDMEYY
jgi:glycerol-1-phosphate dehydrogenase [NAD(P)+]